MGDARHVVVVGAGIAGAAAAHRLRALRPDLRVTVLEGSPAVGGKLAVAEVGGVVIDVGAEAILRRRPEGVALAEACGLAGDLVVPATLAAALWTRGAMRPLPRSLMGVPADLAVLDGVVSAAGLARAREQSRVPTLAPDEDVSVGDLVAEHLGQEVVERLVEPMLGGVYAGHAHALSARAAVPTLVAALDGTRTLTDAAAAAMAPTGPSGATVAAGRTGAVFAGIRGGVGRLPDAALAASGATVETDSVVRGLRPTSDRSASHGPTSDGRSPAGWTLTVGSARDPREMQADGVVLAAPAAPTARLLAEVAPVAAAELAGIEYASMAVVTLALRGLEVSGSGFLVPPVEGRAVKGSTYSFRKWGWVADAGVQLVRASVGRHREEQVLQRTDDEVVALVVADLADALETVPDVIESHVQRWGGGLPQYAVGHLARVARVRAALAGVRGLAVCGAAYDGVGIPAVIGSAQRAADEVLADLPGRLDP